MQDGDTPTGNVIVDKTSTVFGASTFGGAKAYGTLFKVAPDGTESVLHSFCSQPNCTDGAEPYSGLIADNAGDLYGATSLGGADCADLGVEAAARSSS